MEELVPATKLELWCEQFWRDHGFVIANIDRELLKTTYKIVNNSGKESKYTVPLVPVVPVAEFKQEFESFWGGNNAESKR